MVAYAEAIEFLRNSKCGKLLNGDIVDGWHLMRDKNHWKQQYNEFAKLVIGIKPKNVKSFI